MLEGNQKRLLREWKGVNSSIPSHVVPITTEKGSVIGSLRPIDHGLASNKDVIRLLTKWRAMFMEFFLTQFIATEERTERWIAEGILSDDSKILFLVKNETEDSVGNIGIREITPNACELDNVLRGERTGHPRLFYFASVALLTWAFQKLGIKMIFLNVFKDNARAIKLYQSLGFKEQGIIPLRKMVNRDGTQYIPIEDNYGLGRDASLIRMEVNKDEFFRLFTWIPQPYPAG